MHAFAVTLVVFLKLVLEDSQRGRINVCGQVNPHIHFDGKLAQV